MSFFGFDTTLPRDRAGGGYDPSARSAARDDDDDDLDAKIRAHMGNKEDMAVYTWGAEDYDGLGDQLEEEGDAFNDDTFGGGGGVVGTFSATPVCQSCD